MLMVSMLLISEGDIGQQLVFNRLRSLLESGVGRYREDS
jgi:hypothetical protein